MKGEIDSSTSGDRDREPRMGRFSRAALACAATLAVALVATPAADAAGCPDSVSAAHFASKSRLRKMTKHFNSYGPRILESAAHNKSIDWLRDKARAIDGFRVKTQPYHSYHWLPRTHMRGGPGLDIGRAGRITVRRPGRGTVNVPDAGAVHWSEPTSKRGVEAPLVYLPPDQDITPQNAAGKIVVRDFQLGSLPFGAAQTVLGLYVTPDLAGETEYTRPYLSPNLHPDLVAAGVADAAGVIFAFDLPRKEVRGYYDPHVGMLYRVPAVFAGRAQAAQLKAAAARGASADVVVRARVDRGRTRNLIATLPGRSPEKIVMAANTDGNSWVQEDGVIGMLAFARYYAKLPLRCRPRTLQLVFSSSHDGYRNDGLNHYKIRRNKIALAFAIEHLGTREILPTGKGSDRHLEFTGRGDPFLFAAGDSDPLRDTAVATTKRRRLHRTAVLRGLGTPVPGQVPPICSMGGLGNAFHPRLIPTLAMISGPWSLYDPVFGRRAINFSRMRSEVLAAGDSILALDGLSRDEIYGDYTEYAEEAKHGAPTCPSERIPLFAPGPGE
jgi:hypothetical protein